MPTDYPLPDAGRSCAEAQQLAESEEKFRKITESAQDAIIMMGADRCISFWNPAAERMFGYTPDEVLGKEMHPLLAPPDASAAFEHGFTDFLKNGTGPVIGKMLEFTALRKGGAAFPVEVTISALQINGLWNAIGIFRDITERRQAEAQITKSLSLLHATLESTRDAILVVDLNSTWVLHNQQFVDLWHIPDEIIASKDDRAALSYVLNQLENPDVFLKKVHELYAAPEAVSFDTLEFKNGKIIERYSLPQRIDGKVAGRVWSFRDVTAQKQVEQYEQFRSHTLELLAGDEPLTRILEAIVQGVERLNPAMLCSILLLDSDGRHLHNGAAPSLPDFYNAAIDGIEIGVGAGSCAMAAFTGERVIVDDIATHPYWAPYKELAARAGLGACWSQPIRSSSGQVLGSFAIYHHEAHTPVASDIPIIEKTAHLVSIAIERKQMEDQVRHLAFYDPLTNLPNRRLLNDRLGQAIAASKRSGCYNALMFLDLDNFKPLNDQYGHMVGDLLLIEAANRLKSCVREMDTAARLGGDEFVVMLSKLDADKTESTSQARIVAEKIRIALSEPYVLTVRHDEEKNTTVEYHCTASIGVVVFVDHEGSQDDILKRADTVMYKAKESGRNQIQFYEANA